MTSCSLQHCKPGIISIFGGFSLSVYAKRSSGHHTDNTHLNHTNTHRKDTTFTFLGAKQTTHTYTHPNKHPHNGQTSSVWIRPHTHTHTPGVLLHVRVSQSLSVNPNNNKVDQWSVRKGMHTHKKCLNVCVLVQKTSKF